MMVASSPHTDTLVHSGRCPTHGLVKATKQVPKVRFPFLVYGALRLWAHRRSYCCPTCGTAVDRA